jgi:hypothetical protein
MDQGGVLEAGLDIQLRDVELFTYQLGSTYEGICVVINYEGRFLPNVEYRLESLVAQIIQMRPMQSYTGH